MPRISAALCLWRRSGPGIEVLIAHPGGPFFARKDEGAWTFPKGEFAPASEDPLQAARREFAEELGTAAPVGDYLDLGETRLKSGKRILAFAIEGDLDADAIVSNTFSIEWPHRSGVEREFPEVDRALWCSPQVASLKLNPAQMAFVERLIAALSS